jgi:putative membrane protein insertion efficiency factor
MTIDLEPKTHDPSITSPAQGTQAINPAHEQHTDDHPTHSSPPSLRDLDRSIANFPRFILLLLVRFYQLTLSRALPANTCRFYPTCSHYGYEAIYKYGAFKGGWMAFKRILRCQPFNPGGYDPVP